MTTHSSFTCPHCNRPTTVGQGQQVFDQRFHQYGRLLDRELGAVEIYSVCVICPNPECRRLTVQVELKESKPGAGAMLPPTPGTVLGRWNLLPRSLARPLHPSVPAQIREDYEEGHLILDLSPKAAATLARRALQGMIRHFHDIRMANLNAAIKALKGKVEQEVWDAIDAVRQIGNIGAHMEKDVNAIVNVDPNEAKQLLWLVEFLSDEWYKAKVERDAKLAELKATNDRKQAQRKGGPGSAKAR